MNNSRFELLLVFIFLLNNENINNSLQQHLHQQQQMHQSSESSNITASLLPFHIKSMANETQYIIQEQILYSQGFEDSNGHSMLLRFVITNKLFRQDPERGIFMAVQSENFCSLSNTVYETKNYLFKKLILNTFADDDDDASTEADSNKKYEKCFFYNNYYNLKSYNKNIVKYLFENYKHVNFNECLTEIYDTIYMSSYNCLMLTNNRSGAELGYMDDQADNPASGINLYESICYKLYDLFVLKELFNFSLVYGYNLSLILVVLGCFSNCFSFIVLMHSKARSEYEPAHKSNCGMSCLLLKQSSAIAAAVAATQPNVFAGLQCLRLLVAANFVFLFTFWIFDVRLITEIELKLFKTDVTLAKQVYDWIMCKIVRYLKNTSDMLSTLLFVKFSIERLIVAYYPLHKKAIQEKKIVRLAIKFILVFSLIMPLGDIIVSNLHEKSLIYHSHEYCMPNFTATLDRGLMYFSLFNSFFITFIPFILLTPTTVALILKLFRISKSKINRSSPHSLLASDIRHNTLMIRFNNTSRRIIIETIDQHRLLLNSGSASSSDACSYDGLRVHFKSSSSVSTSLPSSVSSFRKRFLSMETLNNSNQFNRENTNTRNRCRRLFKTINRSQILIIASLAVNYFLIAIPNVYLLTLSIIYKSDYVGLEVQPVLNEHYGHRKFIREIRKFTMICAYSLMSFLLLFPGSTYRKHMNRMFNKRIRH
jgi:hypothetical protein